MSFSGSLTTPYQKATSSIDFVSVRGVVHERTTFDWWWMVTKQDPSGKRGFLREFWVGAYLVAGEWNRGGREGNNGLPTVLSTVLL